MVGRMGKGGVREGEGGRGHRDEGWHSNFRKYQGRVSISIFPGRYVIDETNSSHQHPVPYASLLRE